MWVRVRSETAGFEGHFIWSYWLRERLDDFGVAGEAEKVRHLAGGSVEDFID